MNLKLAVGTVLAVCLSGCVSTEAMLASMSEVTPESVVASVDIKNDSLDVTATLTTRRAFQEPQTLFGTGEEAFIRAFVDKSTGRISYQVYHVSNYMGNWRFYSLVNYETPSGPRQVQASVISRDVVSCSSSLGCFYQETVTFEIPGDLMRTMADMYVPGQALAGWKYKIMGQSGAEVEHAILAAEIVGAVMATEQLATRIGHPVPDPYEPKPSPLTVVPPSSLAASTQ